MDDFLVPIFVVGMIFIGLPWVVMHYLTQWKTAGTITNDDEVLLEELYQIAKRLEERMDTVERLAANDMPRAPGARSKGQLPDNTPAEPDPIQELERLLAAKKAEREGAGI